MKEIIILGSVLMTIVLLGYLNKKSVTDYKGENVHSMLNVYLYMGYLMIIMAISILFLPYIILPAPPEQLHPLLLVVFFCFFIFGLWIIRIYRVHIVRTNEKGFIIRSFLGKEKEFKYDNIKSLELSRITYFIYIRDNSGQKGKMYFHLKGLLPVLRKIRANSGKDISDIERLLNLF